jgi:hypothetical protein
VTANEKDSTKITNPKPEEQKHYSNTSEMSKPHTSEAEPEEHVDLMAFGEDGNREPKHDVDHITDEGSKSMGQETYDKHQEDKDK